MGSLIDFTDSAAVSQLVGKHERLVCLQLPDASLYCHSFPLSFSSPVLRNVLEDTQQEQGQLCTIPLAGDSDIDAWQLALGLMYRLEAASISLDNAQALLLLAHKYDMQHITAEVARFLSTGDAATPGSKHSSMLHSDLNPSTVNGWLQALSRCGLEQLVQACIDYIVDNSLPVTMELLTSLDAAHADQLLAAKQDKFTQQEAFVKKLVLDKEAWTNTDLISLQKISSLEDRVRRSAVAVDRAISAAGSTTLFMYKCLAGHTTFTSTTMGVQSCAHCKLGVTRAFSDVDLAGMRPPRA